MHLNIRKIGKRGLFNIILALLSLASYLAAYISPAQWGLVGFIALMLPILLVINFVMIIYWGILRSYKFFISLIILLMGLNFLKASFSLSFNDNVKDSGAKSFKVLSHNVRVFNVYDHLQNKDSLSSKKLLTWLTENEADVKCFQEFYHDRSSKVFNTLKKISQASAYQYYFTKATSSHPDNFFGLAIFSKFPIVNKGIVDFESKNYNKAIFVDLKIHQDTIRVYNVHFQSMSIDENKLFDTEVYENTKKNYLTIFSRLKTGFIKRAKQVDKLKEHMVQSPHPTILCGDFNDTPYSYTYQSLRQKFYNAFEEKGNGFGFSYNGRLFFLRIDNQFFSDKLKIHNFKTLRHINYSDHFPLIGEYSITQ